MIQIKQADGILKDEPRGQQVEGTPFAVVPVAMLGGGEAWGVIHMPCSMPVGDRSPGWYKSDDAIDTTKFWWDQLSRGLRIALETDDIDLMKSCGADVACEQLIRAADFTWGN